MIWIFVHLLLCDVSNQSVSADEDKANKPYRPIPAGRVTEYTAKRLLVALYFLCWAVSYPLGLLRVSVVLGTLAFLYNTLDFSSHWFAKNFLNAAAYVCFEYGGTFIAGKFLKTSFRMPRSLTWRTCEAQGQLDDVTNTALWITFSVIAFTIHSQDLKVRVGYSRALSMLSTPFQAHYTP